MSSLYDYLRINDTATSEEIKTSYRILCKAYHPAINPSGAQRFSEVQKAYTILKDKDSRNMYDLFGEKWLMVVNNEAKMNLILRICDRFNMMLILGTCILIGIVLFLQPLIFCMFRIFKIKGGYFIASIPIYSILFLVLTILIRGILRLRRSLRFKYPREISSFIISSIIIFTVCFQITIFNLYNEGWIEYNMLILQAPYLLGELILLLFRFKSKEGSRGYLILFTMVRILFIQFVNLNIPVVIKVYMGVIWVLTCMLVERFRLLVILIITIVITFIVTGNLNAWLESQKGYLYLFLVPLNIVVFGSFMMIKKIMKGLAPKAIFKVNKMPIDV